MISRPHWMVLLVMGGLHAGLLLLAMRTSQQASIAQPQPLPVMSVSLWSEAAQPVVNMPLSRPPPSKKIAQTQEQTALAPERVTQKADQAAADTVHQSTTENALTVAAQAQTAEKPQPATVQSAPAATVREVSAAAESAMPVVSQPRFDAAYLNNPAPAYPGISRRIGEEGQVRLRVEVSREGRALQVQLQGSSGHRLLDEAALATVRQWRFVPARQGNQTVNAWVLVPIVFKLN